MNGEQVLVAGMMLAAMVFLGKLLIPIAQAYSRRIEGDTRQALPSADLADLETRVRELEAREGRMAELEERMDFSERMLAQHRDQARLGAGEAE